MVTVVVVGSIASYHCLNLIVLDFGNWLVLKIFHQIEMPECVDLKINYAYYPLQGILCFQEPSFLRRRRRRRGAAIVM